MAAWPRLFKACRGNPERGYPKKRGNWRWVWWNLENTVKRETVEVEVEHVFVFVFGTKKRWVLVGNERELVLVH